MASAVVRTDHLIKDFPTGLRGAARHRALDGLTLEVPSGIVFGLLGPNGAGKSTTLKILLDLIRPTSGSAELLGCPPGDAGARRRLGFLSELPSFYDHLTGAELLEYFAGLFGCAPGERRRRASALLERVGLASDRRRPLRQYSRGMLQRLGLAQALVNEPELVVLDEPMSGLDPIGQRLVRDIILELRDSGRTVIFSSHILSDAELLCSRVAILAKGRLAAAGTLADLTRDAGGRGAEIVVSDVPPDVIGRLGADVRRSIRIDEGRYRLELGERVRPEPLVASLAAAGATLVSVAPLRATLEDVFLQALNGVAETPAPAEGAAGPPRAAARTLPARAVPAEPVRRADAGTPGSRIALVARHVFKESVRDRVLYAIAGFALLLAAASLIVGQLSAGEDVKIIKDSGLATIELAGALMAVFIGVGLVAREIERRSIHNLLAKPLTRGELVVGKYIGMLLTIAVNVAAMAAALYVVLGILQWQAGPIERQAWEAAPADPRLLLAVLMIGAELALLTAVALFFSTFSSSAFLSAVLTAGVFLAGLLSADLRGFGDIVDVPPAVAGGVAAIGWFLPAFSAFDIKAQVVHGVPLPPGFVPATLGYAALYIAALIAGAMAIFSRRELT